MERLSGLNFNKRFRVIANLRVVTGLDINFHEWECLQEPLDIKGGCEIIIC